MAKGRDWAWVRGHPWSLLRCHLLSIPALTCRQVGELHPEPLGSPHGHPRGGLVLRPSASTAWLQAGQGTRGPASTGLLWSQGQECGQVPESKGVWFLAPSGTVGSGSRPQSVELLLGAPPTHTASVSL